MNILDFFKKENPKEMKRNEDAKKDKPKILGHQPTSHIDRSKETLPVVEKELVKHSDTEPYQYKLWKREVKQKLTIVLIEDTIKAREDISILQRIIRKLPTNGRVCVISYNDKVTTSACAKMFSFEIEDVLLKPGTSNERCWYDALMAAADVITANYLKTEENEKEIIEINKIELVGVGSCTDTCSVTERKVALEKFSKALKAANITGNYFC